MPLAGEDEFRETAIDVEVLLVTGLGLARNIGVEIFRADDDAVRQG